MKKIFVMALAVAAATACSKNEPAPHVEGEKQQLNILTSIGTRAVISGTTLPQGSAIGVHVTQGNAPEVAYQGENYAPGGENLQLGENVRFDNSANANEWVSQTSGGQAARLMIGATEGTIYGYYPYTATVMNVGADATIPLTVVTTGDIDLSAAANGSKNYDGDEVDYLYYKPAGERAKVSSATTATAPLSMAHALASVSFRMYVSSDAPVVSDGDANYYLMGYTIKNKQGQSLFVAPTANTTMKIADGTITTTAGGGEISRTLNSPDGYALTRVAGADATEGEKGALVWFGNLTLPIPDIASQLVNGVNISDDIEIIFSIKKGLNGAAKNYAVPLVVDTTNGSDKWVAGNNYQYTVKVNAFLGLSIQQVTVTDWNDVIGGDITIE